MVRSSLRYPGGKFKALPIILPLIPDGIEDFREPFFGGGSVTLGYLQSVLNKPKRVTVGDLNPEIANFWNMCKDKAEEVKKIGLEWYNRYKVDTDLWNSVKNVDFSKLSPEERAARLFIINRISFSGMGDSGVLSHDQYSKFRLDHFNRISDVSDILKGIEIRNCSYEEILFEEGKNVFIFLDPPYYTQEGSKLYGKDGDMHTGFPHEKFAEDCNSIKHPWLITLDDCPYVRKLYINNYLMPFKLTYTLAGKTSDNALAGEELMISNYDILNLNNEEYEGEI